MSRKHIPLTIIRPGIEEFQKIHFIANAEDQENYIPFRYPFADIKNYDELKAAGYFRHETTGVDEISLGGSALADAKTNLGYHLPQTEKLILLVKVTSALTEDKKIVVTVEGSTKYEIADVEYELKAADVEAGDILEIDLYNFGLYLNDGEIKITAAGDAEANADDEKVSFGLIARTY